MSKDRLPKSKEVVRLDEVERLNLVLADALARLAHERTERLKIERLAWLGKLDPEGRIVALEKAILEAGSEVSVAETRHLEWTDRVKARLGLQTEFNFDSETGVVTTEIPSGQ